MIKINSELLDKVLYEALHSPRKRKNYNFHKELSDTLQRLLNAMEPDTYVQPHKHQNPDKREAFIILKGKVLIVEFDDSGNISQHIILNRETENYGAEIAPRIFHSVISLEPGSVIYEVKDGPYLAIDDKNFAEWAPKEGDPEAVKFNLKILNQLHINQIL